MTFKMPDITTRRAFVQHVNNALCTWGFAWAWMALRARNPSPSGRATFNPQSTCHGPRPGPKYAYWVCAGSLCAMEPRARGKTRGRKTKKCRRVKKHIYIYNIYNFYEKTKRAPLPGRRREHGRGRPRQSRERRAW